MLKFITKRVTIPSDSGGLQVLVLTPTEPAPAEGRPGVLWIHGGGYLSGMAEMVYLTRAQDLVRKHGAVVVTPEYRLAGKAPYPAALLDCHRALVYLRDHAPELNVRSDQIMVGGESAGGGLTAALCMYEKDLGGVQVAFQMPLYPMIDNEDTETSRDNHSPVWDTKKNHNGWAHYLAGLHGGEVPCYAAAARRKDYSGLPPAYTYICTAEPFYAETMTFVENLRKAGVEAEVTVYQGLFHAFDVLMPYLPVSKQAAKTFEDHFDYAVKHYFAPQTGEKALKE